MILKPSRTNTCGATAISGSATAGMNVARALRTLDVDPRSVVVVGGPKTSRVFGPLGHVVKTDRYRYVKKAFHGTRNMLPAPIESPRCCRGSP